MQAKEQSCDILPDNQSGYTTMYDHMMIRILGSTLLSPRLAFPLQQQQQTQQNLTASRMEAQSAESHAPVQEKSFRSSRVTNDTSQPPQVIAHRGFKRKYPENSLSAFKGAVEAGSNAIELDLALSRDGVVVISHDQSLERCFGVKKNIENCNWEYLKTVEMTQEPHEPVPRLHDLLEYLAQPGSEHVWAFLDVKLTNNPSAIIPQIAKTIASVNPPPNKPWHTRLILGCWSSAFIPHCISHLPTFSMSLVCFDLHAARRFFPLPNLIAYNVNQQVLMGPLGRGFLDDARKAGKKVFVWTVNAESAMWWCIRKGVDGVVTDDPELCRGFVEMDGQEAASLSAPVRMGEKTEIWGISALVAMFGWIFKLKYLPRVDVETRPAPKASSVC